MSASADEQIIRALEDERYQAMLDGDLPALERLCAGELVYTHSNAERDTKESYLDKVKEGVFVYHWIEHPIEQLTVIGDCAVVAGQMRAHVTNRGEERQLDNACLAVWARTDAGWRFVAYQPTVNPKAA
ncbi:nuclear transport factor 2 family protein [Streptomyces sp. NBC_01476]|uniref:nuclear transport factor 2 family protein n=1 Tax=Streptomyces sp. NBC_01476 TaxID=2903881 RepID=UPI002E33A878|nr:nuclear transport factor 2 family protein [Streptomyces sp. NBC_01476]